MLKVGNSLQNLIVTIPALQITKRILVIVVSPGEPEESDLAVRRSEEHLLPLLAAVVVEKVQARWRS